MLHIWGRLSSINVRKAVWAAGEAGMPFQRTDAGGMFGIVQTPDYLRLNPHGLVPVLQDGDTNVWESNVIVRYLASRYPKAGLLPETLALRFEAEQWMDWQQSTTNPAGRDAFLHLVRLPPEQRQPHKVQASVRSMEPLLALLDQHLAQRAYVLGEHFSMGDIPLGCEVHRWLYLPQSRPAWPHLERWFAALQARPAAKGILDMRLS